MAALSSRAVATLGSAFAWLMLPLAAGPSHAATRRVPADQPTVAAALAASASGDTVLIAPGAYHERVDLPAGVSLLADGPPASVTLDADLAGACILVRAGTAGTRIVGLRLIGGRGNTSGGLATGGDLLVDGGMLAVTDCRFEAGDATYGGGTATVAADVVFTRCVWQGGQAVYGGGHFQVGGSVTLDGATFESPHATQGGAIFVTGGAHANVLGGRIHDATASGDGGGAHLDNAVVELSRVVFDGDHAGGRGGALKLAAGAQVLVSFTVFVENDADLGGGAFYVSCESVAPSGLSADCALLSMTHCDVISNRGAAPAAGAVTDPGAVRLINSIVAGNTSGLACLDPRSTLDVTCCDLYRNGGPDLSGNCLAAPGAGNLAVDPYLCDLPARDCGLCANSPLAAPGACDPYWGVSDVRCGPCTATPVAPFTWGQLKALYRR